MDAVSPPDMRDEEDEILAGVGFGPAFYAKVSDGGRRGHALALPNDVGKKKLSTLTF